MSVTITPPDPAAPRDPAAPGDPAGPGDRDGGLCLALAGAR